MRGGGYRLRIGASERTLLRELCGDLRRAIEAGDPSAGRLFPTAYPDDPTASAEYDRLVRGELVTGRLEALATVEETVGADVLDEAQLAAWCGVLNDLRLVLGERLGVTEDMSASLMIRSPEHALYGWLTWLQASVVDALASRL